jgi:hypothetical protein
MMSNDPEGQSERDKRVDEEMASADRANGERPPSDDEGDPQRAEDSDPEAPGAYVDEEHASTVPEPNEPA